MRNLAIVLIIAAMFTACSENKGEIVVAKKDSGEKSSTPQVSNSPQMPSGHPPISSGQQQSQSSMIPGPEKKYSMETGEGNTVKIGPMSFEIGSDWKAEEPSSSFRAAQFSLPPKESGGEPAELAVFQGIGGSADANIQRWIGQFQNTKEEPAVEMKQVGPYHVHILDVEGTYAASMAPMMGGGEPQPNTQMLAAVIEGPGGPWQFKATGPSATVSQHKEAFMNMVDSLKANQQ